MRSSLALLLTLSLALACGGSSEPTLETPPVPALVAPGVLQDAALTAAAGPADSEIVGAYLADCHAVLAGRPTPEEAMEVIGDAANECLFLEVGQNCNPDISGCYSKSLDCQSACGAPCSDCQSTCAGECDTCKSTCGSDAACNRTCAEARANCRTTCLATRDTCRSAGCANVESTCEVEHAAEVVAKCGNCEPMRSCMEASFTNGDYEAVACRTASPGVAEECWTWCNPGL